MQGSWAGAMGQNQFMPSTYLGYAVDFDGDGHRDIWNSLPDVFASMANYLARAGLGRALHLGPRGDCATGSRRQAGAGSISKAPLADLAVDAAFACPTAAACRSARFRPPCCAWTRTNGASFLVYGNFRALMAWNRSTYFGVSVGLLSDS